MLPACGLGGVIALGLAVAAIRWGGFAGWTLGVVAAIVALGGIGMFAFLLWGHTAGYGWHFA